MQVVHLSHGPRANFLNTAFYNNQLQYFVYTDEDVAASSVDPNVRFVAGKEYTPRALFWDYRHGFGSRQQYSSAYETKQTAAEIQETAESKIETIATGHAAPQLNTDGEARSSLSAPWADTLQLPIHPQSRHELTSWEYDSRALTGRLRGSEDDTRFLFFDQGTEEYKLLDHEHNGEYLDSTVRKVVEKCDALAGFNLTTDFAGWGGFSAAMLEQLRDEYSTKLPVLTWASLADVASPGRTAIDSNLDTYLALAEFSGLLVPLAYNPEVSPAATAARQVLLYETVGLMSSLRRDRYSLGSLLDDLLHGTSGINIVTGAVHSSARHFDPANPYESSVKTITHSFRPSEFGPELHAVNGKIGLLRATSPKELTEQQTNMQWANFREDELVEHGTSDSRLHKRLCPQYLPPPTEELVTANGMLAELSLNNGPLALRKLVAPWKHEQRERVFELTDGYVWEWNSDSDYD